jgi:signal transduction histidine kinase/ligand-binding sensor domain-containing protein
LRRSVLPLPSIKRLFLFYILFFAGFYSGLSYSQVVDPSNLLFHFLTIESGLPNNKVNAVAMDKNGFIWFGTNDGICRYDGLNFKNYPLGNISENQARTSQISVIKNDSQGNFMIGTYSLFRYNYSMDRIERCDTSAGADRTGRVYAIEEGINGQIWLGTEKGLFSYNAVNESLTSHPFNRERDLIIISLLFHDRKLWIGTRNDGLLIFDIARNTFSAVDKFRMPTDIKYQINCFYKENNNLIWAGTQDDGIYKFNLSDSSLTHIYPDLRNTLSYRIRKIINDKYGNKWIGSRLGMFLQKEGSDSLILVKQMDPLPSKTRSNSIYDILIDPNEFMWLGTFSFGVGYTNFKRKPFHLYNLSDDETQLFPRMINCFTDCDDENIWIGTEENGLFRFNRNTQQIKQFKPELKSKNSLAGINIKALARDSGGNLWIGYYSSGLDYLEVRTGQITHYLTKKNSTTSVTSNAIRTLLIDDMENLWIGTDKGIDLLEKGSQTFKHHNLNNEVLTLYKDNKNHIWAGSSGDGIYRLNSVTSLFEKVYTQYFSTSIKAILIDSRENLWVGTNKGLYFVDTKTDSLIYSGMNKGLPSNAILDILEDESQNLWVSTGAGLIKCEKAILTPQSFNIKQFSIKDGLQGEYFREFASYKNSHGEFYFGGNQGFNIFNPDSVKSNPYPPRLAFTELKIFNDNVAIGEKIKGRIVLRKGINQTKQLILSYKHSQISIEFAALHFDNPENNKYKFRLSPLEKEWNYSSGIRNFATYSNLQGGEYTFTVEAANSDGLWNPDPLILKIRVKPPFWKTWWFTVIMFIILSAIVYWYYLYRISLLKRHNIELEKKVEDRTHKLKESLDQVIEKQNLIEEQSKILIEQKDKLQELNSTKDKFFSIISHDLRSPFQSLLGLSEIFLAEMTESDKPELKNYAQTINNSSKNIYTLVENLLTWSRTQTNKITFDPSEINISSVVGSVILLLQPDLIQKNISVERKIKSDRNGWADINMIEMVIRNLISNAIKFTPENGEIIIFLSEDGDHLLIEIRDNGIGINIEDQSKLFRIESNFTRKGTLGEKGTGLGLILCKEFIEKNGGKIWIKSKPGEGSSFFFTIPVFRNQEIRT